MIKITIIYTMKSFQNGYYIYSIHKINIILNKEYENKF